MDLGVGEDFPIFIPAATYMRSNHPVTLHLMEGYAFVGSGLPETSYFNLEKRPYITQVIHTRPGPHALRVPSVIPDRKIRELQKQLRELVASDIELGADVRVNEGRYKSLEGKVIDMVGDLAIVEVHLRSIEMILTIPRVFLEVIDI